MKCCSSRRRAFPAAGRLKVTGTVGPMTRGSADVVGMSGELTLAGTIEPRMTTVLLPSGNEADVTARYATIMDDVIEAVLPDIVA